MLTTDSWVDADTVITNPNIPLEVFLPPEEFPHLHLLATADPRKYYWSFFSLPMHHKMITYTNDLRTRLAAHRLKDE